MTESFHRFETRFDDRVCGPSSGFAAGLLCDPGKAPFPLRDSVSGGHSQAMYQIYTPTPHPDSWRGAWWGWGQTGVGHPRSWEPGQRLSSGVASGPF